MRPSCKRMPTKLCMMVEAESDQLCVPAISISIFATFWQWHAAKPKTAPSSFRLRVRLPQSELIMVLLYWFELQSTSEIIAELRMDNLRSGLCSTFPFVLHWISNEYFVEDSPWSLFCWVLHSRDSTPTWSDEGSIFVVWVCVCVGVCVCLFVVCLFLPTEDYLRLQGYSVQETETMVALSVWVSRMIIELHSVLAALWKHVGSGCGQVGLGSQIPFNAFMPRLPQQHLRGWCCRIRPRSEVTAPRFAA